MVLGWTKANSHTLLVVDLEARSVTPAMRLQKLKPAAFVHYQSRPTKSSSRDHPTQLVPKSDKPEVVTGSLISWSTELLRTVMKSRQRQRFSFVS